MYHVIMHIFHFHIQGYLLYSVITNKPESEIKNIDSSFTNYSNYSSLATTWGGVSGRISSGRMTLSRSGLAIGVLPEHLLGTKSQYELATEKTIAYMAYVSHSAHSCCHQPLATFTKASKPSKC
jgi:hypothetical protein